MQPEYQTGGTQAGYDTGSTQQEDYQASGPRQDYLASGPQQDYQARDPQQDYQASGPRQGNDTGGTQQDYGARDTQQAYADREGRDMREEHEGRGRRDHDRGLGMLGHDRGPEPDRGQEHDRGIGMLGHDRGMEHDRPMEHDRRGRSHHDAPARRRAARPHGLPGGWIGEFILGLGSLVIGLIVAAHPTHSLKIIAILLGVLMIVSGVYHMIRATRRAGDHRMWGGIAGILFFLVGIFLLRHVQLTLALIALFAGFAFIIAGIAALAESVTGTGFLGRTWSGIFGLICVFAGIAAITTPIHTVTRLAIVLGWAFAAMGILHMIGAFATRSSVRKEARERREQAYVPGQRDAGSEDDFREVETSGAGARHRRRL